MYKEEKPQNLEQLKRELKGKLVEVGAIRYGDFELKSGIKSNVYFDMRIALAKPQTLSLIAKILTLSIPRNTDLIVLSGLAGEILLGILPQITAIPFCWVSSKAIDNIPEEIDGKEVPSFFQHFIFSQFNNISNYKSDSKIPESTDRILLLDDVFTGGSARREANILLNSFFKSQITKTLVIIDRNEKDLNVNGLFKGSDFN